MPVERTLVILKPDAVARRLVGEIISRFEKAGLRIVGLKMVKSSAEQIERFYPSSEEWLKSVGTKLLKAYQELGISPRERLGTDDPVEVGKMVKKKLVEYMSTKLFPRVISAIKQQGVRIAQEVVTRTEL